MKVITKWAWFYNTILLIVFAILVYTVREWWLLFMLFALTTEDEE